jgi:sarcosine oxidase
MATGARVRPEVIVVGLGAMGSCALASLARRGTRVLGIDRFDPPHDLGSSHAGSRVIRLSYFEHPDYVPLLRRAYEGFDRLARDAGERLRFETGLVAGGAPGNAVAAGMMRSAHDHDLEVEAIDGRDLRRRHPQFSVPDDWELVTERQGGFVRPEATIRSALALAARAGAQIVRNAPVAGWGADGSGAWVEVAAEGGPGVTRFEADALVLAGGAWMPELLGGVGPRLQPTRETIVWIDDAGDPAWQHDALPVWLFDRGDQPAVYGVPAFPGMGTPRGLKVGLHGRGPAVRPAQITEPVDAVIVQETVTAAAERMVGAAARAVVATKHCLYTMSPDSDFVVGLHPSHPNVSIAGGFSGHGFKFAPVMGDALADLALDRRTALPIGFLAPGRFARG